MVAEEKFDSTKPAMAVDKGKGPPKIEEAKKAIEEDMSLGEGPFDQEIGGRRYRVHQSTRKEMGAKQMTKALEFAEQFGYPSGSTIFGEGPADSLYYCPNNR